MNWVKNWIIAGLFVIVSGGVVLAVDREKSKEAFDAGDYATAIKEFPRLLDNAILLARSGEDGSVLAQLFLGSLYYEGEGVEKDYVEAAKWFLLAAEAGNSLASFHLGVMFVDGLGVEKNYMKAVKWWLVAAEDGDSDAQFNLGVMYNTGRGVLQDIRYAYMWFAMASVQGNEDASEARDEVGYRLLLSTSFDDIPGAGLEKAKEMARKCLEQEYKDC